MSLPLDGGGEERVNAEAAEVELVRQGQKNAAATGRSQQASRPARMGREAQRGRAYVAGRGDAARDGAARRGFIAGRRENHDRPDRLRRGRLARAVRRAAEIAGGG